MRWSLPLLALLAACETAPRPSLAEVARAQCERGGIPAGSPGYADCFSRVFQTLGQRRAVQPMPQVPMIATPSLALPQQRQQATCYRVGAAVNCY